MLSFTSRFCTRLEEYYYGFSPKYINKSWNLFLECEERTGEVEHRVCDESKCQHEKVPEELLEEAKSAAKAALEEMDAD